MKVFEGMSPERLEGLVDRFGRQRIAVLGDFFLDKYLEVDPRLAEQSLETAKIAHQVVGVRHSPGAAGTVMRNLAALGAGRLEAIGLIPRGIDHGPAVGHHRHRPPRRARAAIGPVAVAALRTAVYMSNAPRRRSWGKRGGFGPRDRSRGALLP